MRTCTSEEAGVTAGGRKGFGSLTRRAAGRPAALLPLLVAIAACEVPTGLPRLESTFRFPVDSVVIPVTGVSASASAATDLADIDLADDVRRATVLITPVNAAGATGLLTLRITGNGVTVTGVVDVAGPADQGIGLSQAEVRALLGGVATVEASGTLCQVSGCGPYLPPFASVTLKNELELVIQLGGEG